MLPGLKLRMLLISKRWSRREGRTRNGRATGNAKLRRSAVDVDLHGHRHGGGASVGRVGRRGHERRGPNVVCWRLRRLLCKLLVLHWQPRLGGRRGREGSLRLHFRAELPRQVQVQLLLRRLLQVLFAQHLPNKSCVLRLLQQRIEASL